MVDAPCEHLRIASESGSVADAANAERLVGVTHVARRPGFGDVGGQPEPRRSGALERPHVRAEVGIEELVAGHVEADDAGTGVAACSFRQVDVRLLVVVAQRADDNAGGDARLGCRTRDALADGRNHRIDVEPRSHVRERPEAELVEAAPVGRGIDDRLVRHASESVVRAEQRIGGRDVGEEDREVTRDAHHERLVPAPSRRLDADGRSELGRRLETHAPFQVGMKINRDHVRDRAGEPPPGRPRCFAPSPCEGVDSGRRRRRRR